jgi:hypothetical protein
MARKTIKKSKVATLFQIVKLVGSLKERFCFISKLAATTETVAYLECDKCRNVFGVVDPDGADLFMKSVSAATSEVNLMQVAKHPDDPYLPGIIKSRSWDKTGFPCCSPKFYSFKPKKDERVLPPIALYHLCSYDEMGIPTAEEIIDGATRKVVLFCEGCRDPSCHPPI